MQFVILGAGALGSIIAGHLARAGEDVIVIARGDRARYIRQHGITLTGRADFTIACPVITDPVALHGADVLIVAVKTYDMAAALTSLRHLDVGSCTCTLRINIAGSPVDRQRGQKVLYERALMASQRPFHSW